MALATFALAIGLSFIAVSVPAASACKGLESKQCYRNDHCSWIEPYTRKDGVDVAGHCKSKPYTSDAKKKESESKRKSDNKKKSERKKDKKEK